MVAAAEWGTHRPMPFRGMIILSHVQQWCAFSIWTETAETCPTGYMVVDMKLNINLGGHEWRDYLPILSVISMAFKKTQSNMSSLAPEELICQLVLWKAYMEPLKHIPCSNSLGARGMTDSNILKKIFPIGIGHFCDFHNSHSLSPMVDFKGLLPLNPVFTPHFLKLVIPMLAPMFHPFSSHKSTIIHLSIPVFFDG